MAKKMILPRDTWQAGLSRQRRGRRRRQLKALLLSTAEKARVMNTSGRSTDGLSSSSTLTAAVDGVSRPDVAARFSAPPSRHAIRRYAPGLCVTATPSTSESESDSSSLGSLGSDMPLCLGHPFIFVGHVRCRCVCVLSYGRGVRLCSLASRASAVSVSVAATRTCDGVCDRVNMRFQTDRNIGRGDKAGVSKSGKAS